MTAPIAGTREIQLEVLGLVPQQRRDPVALADPELGQRGGEPPRAAAHSPIVVRWTAPSGRRETTFAQR